MCKAMLETDKARVQFSECYPEELIQALLVVAAGERKQLYVVGGTVRDLLLERQSNDLDISVSEGAGEFVRHLIAYLKSGALVDLSGSEEEAARLVWQNMQLDVASFRKGVQTIEEDLQLRDFTINGMGVRFEQLAAPDGPLEIIDPNGGFADLYSGRLRHCPVAFTDDPVRMLRGYRLQATLGFVFEKETEKEIGGHVSLINTVAAERNSYELDLIFDSPRTTITLWAMYETGLLQELLPDLFNGKGVVQPKFHHLDVFEHNMLALEMMEKIIADPGKYFPGMESRIRLYFDDGSVARGLKWAALCHDIGKPETRGMSEKNEGQVTFYGHDEAGREIFSRFAERMRWSNTDKENVAALISMHMHPFHLCNIARSGELTKRAALKLCKRAGDRLLGLFLLAMSDSLAGQGEKKPEHMEDEIVALLDNVLNLYEENIKPVLTGPRLLSGRDLIADFELEPSPLFSEIFEKVELARVEGEVTDRAQVMAWVSDFLIKRKTDKKTDDVEQSSPIRLVKEK
jgi:poly(A) polymerase